MQNLSNNNTMTRRKNTYFAIAVQDAAGITAPTIYVDASSLPQDKKGDKRPAAIAEARKRSSLSRFNNWQFR